MKNKHTEIRIEQCISLAKASNCPRLKVAALLLDPIRNVILADGYNGGPRGADGSLCKGHWCERNGLTMDDLTFEKSHVHRHRGYRQGSHSVPGIAVKANGKTIKFFERGVCEHLTESKKTDPFDLPAAGEDDPLGPSEAREGVVLDFPSTMDKAKEWAEELVANNPPIESGTHMEKGCHHAEFNVICNAAAGGVKTDGAWIIVLAEPCVMCAKLIHHSGIKKVILVDGGYAGGKAGVEYLQENGVEIEEVEGPRDPRLEE